jgi:putative transposase
VETVFLRTIYVLIFIEVGSRRLHFSASTLSPDALFVTQQARNLYIEEEAPKVRFLIRDRDAKFARSFDEVFRTEGVHVIKTPSRPRTPTPSPSA